MDPFHPTSLSSLNVVNFICTQGSGLGPLLLIIYINDLERGVKRFSKFADDTKLGGKVDSRGGGDQIQESVDTLIDWAKDWRM